MPLTYAAYAHGTSPTEAPGMENMLKRLKPSCHSVTLKAGTPQPRSRGSCNPIPLKVPAKAAGNHPRVHPLAHADQTSEGA